MINLRHAKHVHQQMLMQFPVSFAARQSSAAKFASSARAKTKQQKTACLLQWANKLFKSLDPIPPTLPYRQHLILLLEPILLALMSLLELLHLILISLLEPLLLTLISLLELPRQISSPALLEPILVLISLPEQLLLILIPPLPESVLLLQTLLL